MKFVADATGRFRGAGLDVRCALGPNGVVSYDVAREGDGATPAGVWPLRRVFFRPDRMRAPRTGLQRVPLRRNDGWCDAPGDPLYNRPVALPYPASAEKLWREDEVYDLIVELGFNDDPVVDGKGSAIFLHLKRGDYEPTQGCVALARADLLQALAAAEPGSTLEIRL